MSKKKRAKALLTVIAAIIAVGATTAFTIVHNMNQQGLSAALSSETSVFLYDTVLLENEETAYVAEDIAGNLYTVEATGYSLDFSQGASFAKVHLIGGRWYITDLLNTPVGL